MNNKKKVFATLLVLVLLIGGATLLYNNMAAKNKPDNLQVVDKETSKKGLPGVEKKDSEAQDNQESAQTEEPQQTLAPNITFYTLEGEAVELEDFLGKPTVINFWASWCPPCKMEMPDFEDAYLEMGDEINFVMLNMVDGRQETVEKASKFIEDEGYTFPVFFDTEQDGAATYQVSSLPSTYFLDKDGYLVAGVTGAIDEETLRRGIQIAKGEEISQ